MDKPKFRVPRFKIKRGFSRKLFLSGIALAILIFSVFMYYDNFKYKVFVSEEIVSNIDMIYKEATKLNLLVQDDDTDIYEVILSIDRIERGLDFLYSSAVELKRYSHKRSDKIKIENRVCIAYSSSKVNLIKTASIEGNYDQYISVIKSYNDSLISSFDKFFVAKDGAMDPKDYNYYSDRIVNREVWIDFLLDLEFSFSEIIAAKPIVCD